MRYEVHLCPFIHLPVPSCYLYQIYMYLSVTYLSSLYLHCCLCMCLSVCLSVCHLSVSLFLPSLFSLLSLFSFLLSLLLYSTCFIGFNCV